MRIKFPSDIESILQLSALGRAADKNWQSFKHFQFLELFHQQYPQEGKPSFRDDSHYVHLLEKSSSLKINIYHLRT